MIENNKKVPKLRFGEFEGEWEEIKLGRIGNFLGGGTPDTKIKDYWKGNIPWISSSDIVDDDIHTIKIHRWINENSIKKTATKIIPKESILLISRVGVGKLAINKEEICTSQDFSNFVPFKCNSYFVGYYLLGRKKLLLNFSQGTSIKGFTTSDIKDLKINLPSLPEQQKIASFLSAVDKKIQHLDRKKALLESYKKGVMQQLFSQEIRFKDEEGKDFSEWQEKRLGEITNITTGSSNRVDSSLIGKYTFFDRSIDIRTSDIYLFDAEAVIIPGEGQKFVPKYFEGKFDLHQRTYAIMDFQNCIGKFIFYYISFHTNYLLSQAVGSTVKSLRLPMFKKMNINLPSIKEQQKIANFLSALDKKIAMVSNQISQTQSFKKGLLQEMFV